MSVVGGPVIRRIVQVSSGPQSHEELLASVGLSPDVDPSEWMREVVSEDAYYELLERATAEDDFGLPFRYGSTIRVDDFGALGLGFKTAATLGDALQRLVRYILVLSDTLEYELVNEVGGAQFVLSRPNHRRGAQLANECALAATTAILREINDAPVTPLAVSFRHPQPESAESHRSFFGCPVRFGDRVDALHLSDTTLQTRTRLADEGLSMFILASLDELKGERVDRSLPSQVQRAVTDSLPDGRATKRQIARRLGMSERTLHRRLSDEGQTFQEIANRAQREAAESLLAHGDDSLAEIAFLTGFSDQSSFSRAFKNWTGATPLAFREAASA